MTAYINLLKKLSVDMFLNKSVLLATITSILARKELIPAGTGTRIKSLNPARIPTGTEFQYISTYVTFFPIYTIILKVFKYINFNIYTFTNRIPDVWNKLPQDIVSAPSLSSFKIRVKKFDLHSIISLVY